MKRRYTAILLGAIIASTVIAAPAYATPVPAGSVKTGLQPPDDSSSVAAGSQIPAVTPDTAYTTTSGSRVEVYTSVGDLDKAADWRNVDEFAYLVNSVPKNQTIRSTIYNSYWDGGNAVQNADGSWNWSLVNASTGTAPTSVFSVTQAFLNQINQYSSKAEAQTYVQAIGNASTINDALGSANTSGGSSLASLLSKTGTMKLCTNKYGKSGCVSQAKDALFHSKYALLSQAKDSTGKLWNNVIWITSSNLNGRSGGDKSNTSIAIFGDATGYNNLLTQVWTPAQNQDANNGDFWNAAVNGATSSSSDFLYVPSPRYVPHDVDPSDVHKNAATKDLEGNFLKAQTNAALTTAAKSKTALKKTSCKVYVVHSLFNTTRDAVYNDLITLQKDGCAVKVLAGPPTVQSVTDSYFAMNQQLRKFVTSFMPANVHDKTISVSYTLSGKSFATTLLGSANLNGTSLTSDELMVKINNKTFTTASETHSAYIYKLADTKTKLIPVASIKLNQGDLSMSVGQTTTYKATVLPTNASQKGYIWSSSDPSVASIDSNGKVTANKIGVVTISASTVQGHKVASATVSIIPPGAQVNDFNGDGYVDEAVINRGNGTTPPSITVRYGNSAGGFSTTTQTIVPSQLNFTEFPTTRYTTAVTKDVNYDGIADLIVGAPSVNGATGEGTGSVYVIYGSKSGLVAANDPSNPQSIVQLKSPVTGTATAGTGVGSFGTSLGVVNAPLSTILVGEPYVTTKAGSKNSAGMAVGATSGGLMHAIPLAQDGTVETSKIQTISQDTFGVPGADEAGDQFGATIAASGSIAAVGSPGEDDGKITDAGGIAIFRFTSTGFTAVGYTQDTKGVPGASEKYDHFGEVLAKDGSTLVVGIPHEDIGKKADAGSILPATVTSSSVTWAAARSQDSTGIPGGTEPFDKFGQSVAIVRTCTGQTGYAVGVPGEDIGSTASGVDQGLVDVVPAATPTKACPARELVAGRSPLAGTAGASTSTPLDLSVLRLPGSSLDSLLVTTKQSDGSLRLAQLPSPYTSAAASWTMPTDSWVVRAMPRP